MLTQSLVRRFAVAISAFLVTAVAVAQLAPPPTEDQLKAAGATQIKGDDLAQMLRNQTLEHTNLQTGQAIFIFYREDGRRFVGLGSSVRETKWWIKDDMRCEDSVAGRSAVCQKIYRHGDTLRICTAGEAQCQWLVEAMPGDVRKLVQ